MVSDTWFVTKHPETMVLPMIFTKLFGLSSKTLNKKNKKKGFFCLENFAFLKNKQLLSLLEIKDRDKRLIKN